MLPRSNPKNLQACKTLLIVYQPYLSRQECHKIFAELAYQQQHDYVVLPRCVIHADLFRDNHLFVGNQVRVSVILDCYGSCNDFLLLDIAIAINDWCRKQALICRRQAGRLISGYQSVRPLQ